ncbi:MAG: hypothetical protein KDA24_17805, partial [Deltaproteobacteria bacterium]|nr:hypothetical protein [Deltaproteobacteria bacterium]
GVSELALGPAALAAEARARSLPYVATNWQQEGEASFPRVLRVSVPSGEETVDIAFLGVTDPTFATGLPTELLEGLTLVDPVSSVQAEVDALRASPTPPQLVVLLVQPSAELQQRLRSVLYGVDLMLGDPTAATFRVASSEVRFRNVGGAFKAAPITLPLDGIAAATVTLGEAPERVVVRPLEVSSTSPMDRELTATLSELHAREDVELGKPLIPPDEPLAGVSEARWTKLVCEALLQRTGADAAFLDGLAFHRPTPGPLTERQVVDRLRGGHIVEVHRIDGNRLAALLPAADGMTPVRCGAPTNTFFPRVHGRFVDPNRTYRIATTDVTRRGPLGPLLSRGSSELIGHQPKFRAVQTDDGPLTLATAVLETLEEAAEDEDWVTSWLDRTPNQWRPQLLLNIRRLGLHITWFEGARTDRYEAVPESLLNSPSSFTLGGGADIALEGSSAKLLADLRFTANYVRFVIAGLPPQEVADDWVLSTSLEAPVLGTPYARWFQVRPFVQASLDSEFTPFVADNGTELPQQADLSAFGGIAFSPGPWLRSFRLGPFVNRDLGRLTDKGTEFGARLTGATRHLLPPRAVILVSTAWDVQVFADTPQDDAADLRLRAWGEVRGSVRLVRALSLGIFAQGLLVQGRVPQTSTPAGSITVGASFDLSTAVRLDVRPRVFP